MTSRTHLTIAEKNELRRYHAASQRDVSQSELLDWVRTQFGKTIARSTLSNILREPIETQFDERKSKRRVPLHGAVDAALLALIDAAPDKAALTDDVLWTHAKRIEFVSKSWIQRFKKRHGLMRSSTTTTQATATGPAREASDPASMQSVASDSATSDRTRAHTDPTHSSEHDATHSDDSERDNSSKHLTSSRYSTIRPPNSSGDVVRSVTKQTTEANEPSSSAAVAAGNWTSPLGGKRQAVDIQTKQQVIAWIESDGGGVPSRAAAHFSALGWRLDPGVFRRWWRQRSAILATDATKKRLRGGGRKRHSVDDSSSSIAETHAEVAVPAAVPAISSSPSLLLSTVKPSEAAIIAATNSTVTNPNTGLSVCNPSAPPLRIQRASATTDTVALLVTRAAPSATADAADASSAPSPPPHEPEPEPEQPPLPNLHTRAQKRQRTSTTTSNAITTMSNMNQYIDHTLLKADALPSQVRALCEEAAEHAFCSVCVNASFASYARDVLDELAAAAGADAPHVKVCCVVGFPLGATLSSVKAFEARECLAAGAEEIDMVVNVGRLIAGETDVVLRDICAVVAECKARKAVCKVILETALLTPALITQASELALAAGADFLKTSTGFSTRGASVEDVKLMVAVAAPAGKFVKASGGIRSAADAHAMIAAGATRLGTSAGVKIVQGETSDAAY